MWLCSLHNFFIEIVLCYPALGGMKQEGLLYPMHKSSEFKDVRLNPSKAHILWQKSCALLIMWDESRILTLNVNMMGLLICVVSFFALTAETL